jgi:hypothetical protein
MQNHDWIDLIRMIPEVDHNRLVLTTLSGVDLSIETIIRTEKTFLVFRGRVCGQTDDGRVFFLPYRQVDYLQINRIVGEAEINELFGETDVTSASGLLDGPPGSALEFPVGAPPESSPGVAPAAPQVPAAAVRPAAPARAGGPKSGASAGNVPAAALVPPTAAGANGNATGAAVPRNSILERLRAQRNAVLPPRPPQR